MKLWRIERTDMFGCDSYDSAVVAAESEDAARNITPDGAAFGGMYSTWAPTPEQVKAEYIGEARPGMKQCVILASFNRG